MDSRERLQAVFEAHFIAPIAEQLALEVLASDWLRDTLAAEREAEKADVLAWLAASQNYMQGHGDSVVVLQTVSDAMSRNDHRGWAAIRNLEPEASDDRG